MEARLKQLLEELTRSLCEAMAESPEVHERLEQVRREGYTLNLFLDCKPSDDETGSDEDQDSAGEDRPAPRALTPPVFRIDGRDLAFLRSVGIDPTRKTRSRTSRQPRLGDGPTRAR